MFFFSLFNLHPLPYSAPFFHSLLLFSLWLIALMFFLWSTATSSSSDLGWPHVFWAGLSRSGGLRPTRCPYRQHQNNMSHSCLMTSAIQPCSALTAHLHPEGSCFMKAIYLFISIQQKMSLLRYNTLTMMHTCPMMQLATYIILPASRLSNKLGYFLFFYNSS